MSTSSAVSVSLLAVLGLRGDKSIPFEIHLIGLFWILAWTKYATLHDFLWARLNAEISSSNFSPHTGVSAALCMFDDFLLSKTPYQKTMFPNFYLACDLKNSLSSQVMTLAQGCLFWQQSCCITSVWQCMRYGANIFFNRLSGSVCG